MQRVKIFAWCASGDASGVEASKEVEKRINSYLRRYPDVRLVSVHPVMNSDLAWTEMSVTCVLETKEEVEATEVSEDDED